MAACWIGLIFAVKPNNEVVIFVLAGLIGIIGFLLLPVGLELGVEITRCAETSSSMLWMSGNLWTLIFVLGMYHLYFTHRSRYLFLFLTVADALREKNPPYSMRNALIFFASFISASTLIIFKFTGHQTRRAMDMDKNREANNIHAL